MDTAAEIGRNPVSKHQIQPEYGDEQADAGPDCRTRLARPNFQARMGTGTYSVSLSADHEQDWQPYPVDPSLALRDDHTYILMYTYINRHVGNTKTEARTHFQPLFDQNYVHFFFAFCCFYAGHRTTLWDGRELYDNREGTGALVQPAPPALLAFQASHRGRL